MAHINASSFIVLENKTLESGFKFEDGTVELTLGRETKRVHALRFYDGVISARGIYGTYRTSSKHWPASLIQRPDGTEYASFGRDDRSGKFNKLNSLHFE